MKGMQITPEVLLAIGCTKFTVTPDYTIYKLKSNGYEFVFQQKETYWDFFMSGNPFLPSHAVTHLDECFGCIAADMFAVGREYAKDQLAEFIGVKREKQ